jgi:protein-S-isoprenylcysteine O-methyltransferase Ste14
MYIIDYVILGLWVAFWIYWLVEALGAKQSRTRPTGFIGIRVALVLVLVALLRGGVLKGHAAVVTNPWLQGIGFAVFLCGLALAVWARVYLGSNWGRPMSQKLEPELVTTGPYRNIRHPIYSGLIMAMIGTAIAISWFWVIAIVVLGSYFVYSAFVEERNMEKTFPDTYPQYKRSTKRLIPFVF